MKYVSRAIALTVLLSLSTLATAGLKAPLVLGYWGNWHVYNTTPERSVEQSQIPGSFHKDTRAVVVNNFFKDQLSYVNAVAYSFFEVYPDVGMNSDLPQKPVDKSKLGTVYFSDPWADLFNNSSTINFCANHDTTCYFAFNISTHWRENPPEVDKTQPWNYFYMGNFDAFTKLNTQRIISIGGWYHEKSFEDGAFVNMQNFSDSIIAIINKARDQGGDINGIDFDYEPAAGYTAENAEKLAKLAKHLRTELDKHNMKNVMITAAVFASPQKIESFGKKNWEAFASVLDYIGLMTYDFHGIWDNPAITGLHSNVFDDPLNPNKNDFSADKAVKALMAAGVPAAKIMLGVPSYGRLVGGVTSKANNGLYQTFDPTIKIQADLDLGQVSYHKITEQWLNQGYQSQTLKLNEQTIGAWAYNSAEKAFVSFDTIDVVDAKTDYILKNKLGGIMMWELIGDTETYKPTSLVKRMAEGLKK